MFNNFVTRIVILVVDMCDLNPCNGGKCVPGGPEGYICEHCPAGMLGKHCDGMRYSSF